VTIVDPGSPEVDAPSSTAIPRTLSARVSSIWVLIGIATLILAAPAVFVAQNTDESQVPYLTLHDRRSVTIALLTLATAAWIFTLRLTVTRILQVRRIARRHRLENLATAWMATASHTLNS
jgi:lipopolysaccharide assembly protein A